MILTDVIENPFKSTAPKRVHAHLQCNAPTHRNVLFIICLSFTFKAISNNTGMMMKSIRTHSNCQSWQCKWAHCFYCGWCFRRLSENICFICIRMQRVIMKYTVRIRWMCVFSQCISLAFLGFSVSLYVWFHFRKCSLISWLLMLNLCHSSTLAVLPFTVCDFWLILILQHNAQVKVSNEIPYSSDWLADWKCEIFRFTFIRIFCVHFICLKSTNLRL